MPKLPRFGLYYDKINKDGSIKQTGEDQEKEEFYDNLVSRLPTLGFTDEETDVMWRMTFIR